MLNHGGDFFLDWHEVQKYFFLILVNVIFPGFWRDMY